MFAPMYGTIELSEIHIPFENLNLNESIKKSSYMYMYPRTLSFKVLKFTHEMAEITQLS